VPYQAVDYGFEYKSKKYSYNRMFTQMIGNGEITVCEKADFIPWIKPINIGQALNLFKPTRCTWTPDWELTPSLSVRLEPLLYHLKHYLNDDNEALWRYQLGYLAHMLQYPGEKPGTMLVLVSQQGLGKICFTGF
jgi:hypothetical protein